MLDASVIWVKFRICTLHCSQYLRGDCLIGDCRIGDRRCRIGDTRSQDRRYEIPSKRQGTHALEITRGYRNSRRCRNSSGCMRLSDGRLQERRNVSEISGKRQVTEGMCRNSSVFRNGCRCRNSKLCRNSWGCLRLSGRRLQDRRYVPEIAGKRQDTHASEITRWFRSSSGYVQSHRLSTV